MQRAPGDTWWNDTSGRSLPGEPPTLKLRFPRRPDGIALQHVYV